MNLNLKALGGLSPTSKSGIGEHIGRYAKSRNVRDLDNVPVSVAQQMNKKVGSRGPSAGEMSDAYSMNKSFNKQAGRARAGAISNYRKTGDTSGLDRRATDAILDKDLANKGGSAAAREWNESLRSTRQANGGSGATGGSSRVRDNYSTRRKAAQAKSNPVDDAANNAPKPGDSAGPANNPASPDNVKKYFQDNDGLAYKDKMTKTGRAKGTAAWATGNIRESALAEGRSMGGALVRDGMIGAVAGGAIGGTMEAAQGGSFWTGAKEGAFNGAVGIGGARIAKRATGADSYLLGKNSIAKSGKNMWNASGKSGVSKQATALINQKQWEGLSNSVTKGGNPFKAR